ncbi:MAG: hypothetical protein JSS72_01015 [Armatimonadetes bacterium]|nr:hypothetical protein [Armatimonadota bacterium]
MYFLTIAVRLLLARAVWLFHATASPAGSIWLTANTVTASEVARAAKIPLPNSQGWRVERIIANKEGSLIAVTGRQKERSSIWFVSPDGLRVVGRADFRNPISDPIWTDKLTLVLNQSDVHGQSAVVQVNRGTSCRVTYTPLLSHQEETLHAAEAVEVVNRQNLKQTRTLHAPSGFSSDAFGNHAGTLLVSPNGRVIAVNAQSGLPGAVSQVQLFVIQRTGHGWNSNSLGPLPHTAWLVMADRFLAALSNMAAGGTCVVYNLETLRPIAAFDADAVELVSR